MDGPIPAGYRLPVRNVLLCCSAYLLPAKAYLRERDGAGAEGRAGIYVGPFPYKEAAIPRYNSEMGRAEKLVLVAECAAIRTLPSLSALYHIYLGFLQTIFI